MKEWHMRQYEDMPYLHKKVLSFRAFPQAGNTHAHCELCWDRFSMYSGDLHSGYYESESNSWICCSCYRQFAELFGWAKN